MSKLDNEIRTRQGECPTHGRVQGEKRLPKLAFPFVITAPAHGFAAMRPYRCPDCGAKVS